MTLKPTPQTLFFETQSEWETWLADNYSLEEGVILKFAKKGSGVTSINYDEALDIALCYGWIDGQVKRIDEIFYGQKFTPRRTKSIWSKRNIGKVEELIASDKMKRPGLDAIEAAKADGRWEQAYDSPANATVPPELEVALNASPTAKAFFETLSKANRYAIIWRITTARKPETRAARLAKIMTMLESKETFH
jgi:uncharacterized protein YdeI (YjbR/CyaY-like superfamily)